MVNKHNIFIQKALLLAKEYEGCTVPNPAVGCIIVKDGNIISQGVHKFYGGKHAEADAIESLTNEQIKGSDLYVTLEPCSHFGKQPPCCDLIVKKGIKNVYYCFEDPDSNVNGKGIKYLQNHGVTTHGNFFIKEAWDLNEGFFYHRLTNLPLISIKWACSIDAKLNTYANESKWITNEKSRNYGHILRNKHQAILIGSNTLNIDNPLLNVRNPSIKNPSDPIKIILSSSGDVNLDSRIFQYNPNKVIVVGTPLFSTSKEKLLEEMGVQVIKTKSTDKRVNLVHLLHILGEMNIVSVLVEGGGSIIQSFIKERIIQKLHVFMGNCIIGGQNNGIFNSNVYSKITETPQFILQENKIFDDNIYLSYNSDSYDTWKKYQQSKFSNKG